MRFGRVLAYCFGLVALALTAALAMTEPGNAQSSGSGLPSAITNILQQLQQQPGGAAGAAPQSNVPQTQTIQAPASPPAVTPTSRIELILSDRAGLPMHQFGYDFFAGLNQITISQVGTIQKYYLLGPGDEVLIGLRGQENANYDVIIDNNGNVTLPLLPPIQAAGRTFEEFQAALTAAVKKYYVTTDVTLSVGQLRRVNVMVAGEVNAPGVKQLTGLSTPLDALILALGVKKSGSLRDIKIYHAGQVIPYDLYHVLLNDGGAAPIYLADGDRIVVPTLGHVAAVSGWVQRPGIYELPPGQSTMSAAGLLQLAGGFQIRGSYRVSEMTTELDGRQHLTALASINGQIVHDGDLLFVDPSVSEKVGQFEFFGTTSLAGEYSLSRYPTLHDILSVPGVLGQSPYMLFGVISRKDSRTQQRRLVAFNPQNVIDGATDIKLQSEDIVRVLNLSEGAKLTAAADAFATRLDFLDEVSKPSTGGSAEDLLSTATQAAINNAIFHDYSRSAGAYPDQSAVGAQPLSATLSALSSLAVTAPAAAMAAAANPSANPVAAAPGGSPSQPGALLQQDTSLEKASAGPFVLDQRTSSEGDVPITSELKNVADLGLQIGVDPVIIISLLADRRVSLGGAVRNAGDYLVGGPMTLDQLLEAAGGPLDWTDMSSVEITRTDVDQRTGQAHTTRGNVDLSGHNLASISVNPRDTFRFSMIFNDVDMGTVVVEGEVHHPGTFDLVRGERVSALLNQAGGLTTQAYPYGAVFLRKSVAQKERAGFEHTANDIENQLVLAVARGSASDTTAANSSSSAATATFLQGVIQDLRGATAVGRMVMIADPAVLAAHPEQDIALEPGDFLFVPQRPSTITVSGEVLNSGTFEARPDLDVSDYIDLAGGYGRYADTGYVYVVNPDGTARSVETSVFSFASDKVAPGSLIVVPRDLLPTDFQSLTVEVAKVISDLAVAAASLTVIGRNN